MSLLTRLLTTALTGLLLTGCATRFPSVSQEWQSPDGLDGRTLLDRSLAAHGGDLRDHPGDLNLATDGRWYALIQRIQPIVTDADFRVTSEERFSPSQQIYAVRHRGPAGVKQVVRRGGDIEVYYNGERETDPQRLRATAMTSDAFQLFHFGPSFLHSRATRVQRMPDARDSGKRYLRMLVDIAPGFGEADSDQVVVWLDPDSYLMYRVHLTLNGFETTQGAHVDTTFSDYRELDGVMIPTRFHERVRGPLQIDAHSWWVTGADAGRQWEVSDLERGEFSGAATAPAAPLE